MSIKEWKKMTLTGKVTHSLWKCAFHEEAASVAGRWRHIDGTAKQLKDLV
jgi:hypothetical protein